MGKSDDVLLDLSIGKTRPTRHWRSHPIGSILSSARIHAKINLFDAAGELDLHDSNLRAYENGHCYPTGEEITAMSKLYGTNIAKREKEMKKFLEKRCVGLDKILADPILGTWQQESC